MTAILVGVDSSERSLDAIAFARRVASGSGGSVLVANAFPYDDRPSRISDLSYRKALESDARATVLRMCAELQELPDARVRTTVVAQQTPARALHELAELERVDLVVVGSSHVSAVGRVMPGSTGERLLHGSSCPVAIVPRDHRGESGFRRVGVAFDGSPEAEVALRAAVEIASATGAALRVIRVLDPVADTMPKRLGGQGYLLPRADLERKLRRELDDTVGGLPPTMGAEAILLTGDAGHVLAEESGSLDLLITGSRGYGPLRAVMAGAVTGRLLRNAACPVIVLPRGSMRCSTPRAWTTTDAVAQGAA